MNIRELLDQVPRLRAWADIGPVQRAELEQFAQLLLDSQNTAVTADGVLAKPGMEVWIIDGVGGVKPTSVRNTEAVTNYYLFGNIPVAHSFSSRQSALNHQKYNDN
jgi:hypothetical protein